MMREYGILGILMYLSVRYVQSSGCRLDVFEKCFGMDFHVLDDPNTVKKVCKPQTLLASLVCIDEIKGECEREQGQEMDTSGWPAAMTLYCEKVDILIEHSGCIKKARRDVQDCVPDSLHELNEKMIRRNGSVKGDNRLVLKTICEHKEERQKCFDHVLSQTCPAIVNENLLRVSAHKTKATCIYGGFDSPSPTQSSGRVTEKQPRPPSEIVPDKRHQRDPQGSGVLRHSLDLITVLISLFAFCCL